MNETWRDVQEKNYVKSLDHSSYYFKANEKKILSSKAMIAEVKELTDKKTVLDFPDALIHRHAHALFAVTAERQLIKSEADKCVGAFEKVIAKLVGVKSLGGKPSTSTKVGTKVLTRYGVGTISGASGTMFDVKLSQGLGPVVKVPREEMLEAPALGAASRDNDSNPLYVGQSGYLFLRYYFLLCDRLARAEAVCAQVEKDQRVQIKHVVERNGSGGEEEETSGGVPESMFTKTLEHIKQFLRGNMDANKFEDDLYNLLGTQCYFLFTLDKLLNVLLRSTSTIVGEDRTAKVLEVAAKYSEKKTAANAVELYRNIADCLAITTGCAAASVRFVPGSIPYCPPNKRSTADTTAPTSTTSNDDKILAGVDLLWEVPPQIVLAYLDAIPQAVTYGAAASGRSLSPVGFDADGSAVATEMGELQFALPIKFDSKIKGSPSAAQVPPAEESVKSKKADAADSVVIAIFTVEKMPGSDDVFRRINAFKNESQTEKDWWKSTSQVERTLSPAPEESESSNEDGPSAKRMREGGDEIAE